MRSKIRSNKNRNARTHAQWFQLLLFCADEHCASFHTNTAHNEHVDDVARTNSRKLTHRIGLVVYISLRRTADDLMYRM